jgi:hypothetical protein
VIIRNIQVRVIAKALNFLFLCKKNGGGDATLSKTILSAFSLS